jgi:hypothetical protein
LTSCTSTGRRTAENRHAPSGSICGCLLTSNDWRQGRLALLDENFKLVEMRQIVAQGISPLLDRFRPICWTCHQERLIRQPRPHRILKGERAPVLNEVGE